jgi:DNA-binding MarR family transcriptional regulator
VKRVRDSNDRRKFIVQLTQQGRALIEKVLPIHAEVAEQVFSVLGVEELEEFGRMLKVLGKSAISGNQKK